MHLLYTFSYATHLLLAIRTAWKKILPHVPRDFGAGRENHQVDRVLWDTVLSGCYSMWSANHDEPWITGVCRLHRPCIGLQARTKGSNVWPMFPASRLITGGEKTLNANKGSQQVQAVFPESRTVTLFWTWCLRDLGISLSVVLGSSVTELKHHATTTTCE